MSIKSFAEQAASSFGAVHLLRYKNRANARILMYHRFPGSPEDLQRRLTAQCEHLRRYYHPISLDELAQAVRDDRSLPPNSLAITIDDGYRDFELAFPVFQEFGLKVTLYVVAGFAAGDLWLWPDQLLYLLENSSLEEAEVPIPTGYAHLDLTNPSAAFDSFCQTLIGMPNQDRLNVLHSLPAILKTELPTHAPERFAPLSWPELRAMAAQGLDIGAHTVHHPILSKLEIPTELQQEIAGSKARIEEATGVPVKHFCYPNGKFPDVNDAVAAAAEAAGFSSAVLAESGWAGPPFSMHRLKRIGVDPGYHPLYFERCVAGYRL